MIDFNEYCTLIEMAMPSNKRAQLKDMLDDIDDSTLDEIFKILSRTVVNDAVENMLDGTDSPIAARSKLRNDIFSSSKVKLDDFTDFAEKLKNNEFDKQIESILLKQGTTDFAKFRKIHPFIDAIFDELIVTKAGMGSGVRKAGNGEYLFMLFGAQKPKVGDVRWKGKDIEVKADGADISPGGHAGYPAGINYYRRIHSDIEDAKKPYPLKQHTAGGNQKYIKQYGHEAWIEWMDKFAEKMFPTPIAQKHYKNMMKNFTKSYSIDKFTQEFGKLVLKCMFDDEKLDAITLVSIKRSQIVTIVDPNKIPDDFKFNVASYLVAT